MALGFGFRRPVALLDERCDRCGAAATIRYAKDVVVELRDFGVEVKRLDLLACDFHMKLNGAEIAKQGFVPVEVAR